MTKPKPARKDYQSKPKRIQRAHPTQSFSKRRMWLFRLLTLFLIPAAILGALELALRVAGYGYPANFFIKSQIEGHDFLITSDRFGRRFFPKEMTRTPSLFRISADKPPDVYRIFVFGESAALGDVDVSYGMPRYLEALLDERFRNTKFEVVCVAMPAINSHAILPIAREVVRLDGDLWVVYMGNNEMVGPFGAGTVFGAKAPSLRLVRSTLAIRKTRVGQLISDALSRLNIGSSSPEKWGGINMFKEHPLRHDNPARLRAYRNFEDNLADMLEMARKADIPIVLSTVASNLKDCSPFVSLHRKGLSAAALMEWAELFGEGLTLEKTDQYEAALERYSKAVSIDSEYAELQFRIGTCLLALGHTERARQAFKQAREHDGLAIRADSRINRILMDADSGGNGQIRRVDAAEALSDLSEEGIAGEEFFFDHVHFTLEGNYAVARIMARQVSELLPPAVQASQTDTWLDADACNRRLALTAWDHMRLLNREFQRISEPPFTSQTSNPASRKYITDKHASIRRMVTPDTAAQGNSLYEAAIRQAPQDTMLIGNYAQFLAGMGKTTEAIMVTERWCTMLPDASSYYYRASLLAKVGRLEEARAVLDIALEMNSDLPPLQVLSKKLDSALRSSAGL